jgi:pyruvate dehydrogenase (quinone)
MSKTVSDYLVKMLVEAGVKSIYAITGDSLNRVNDAVPWDGRLQCIHIRYQ